MSTALAGPLERVQIELAKGSAAFLVVGFVAIAIITPIYSITQNLQP